MVESGDDLLDLATISFDHKRLAGVVNEHVAENAALRVEQEGIHAASEARSRMLFVTMPFSQRTRSPPVSEIRARKPRS